MEQRVEVDPSDVDDEATTVSVCPSCAERARALALPQMRGVTVTSIVVTGADGVAKWTVMARRGHNVLASAQGSTQEDALFDALKSLGIIE